MNDAENPYRSPQSVPDREARRPLWAYFAAAWAGFMAGVLTFVGLAVVELVVGLIFWPLLPPYKSIWPPAVFWPMMAANLIASLTVGA